MRCFGTSLRFCHRLRACLHVSPSRSRGPQQVAPLAATTLPHVPLGRGEVVVPAAPFRSVRQGGSPILDVIAFAGANRLLLTFDYPDSTRRGLLRQRLVEPYSLRRPQTGNLLLYAWNPESDGIRAYNVARIRNPQITGTPFLPRYRVEFAAPHFPS